MKVLLPRWLVRELRTDHAGEAGAVAIYQGVLAVARDAETRAFASRHMATERRHLELIEAWLAPPDRSALLPLWRAAGFVTGAIPALLGRDAVYTTVDAVETFVDLHYRRQVDRLAREGGHEDLRACLEACRLEEVQHRDEARSARRGRRPLLVRAWCTLVRWGSVGAVMLARYV